MGQFLRQAGHNETGVGSKGFLGPGIPPADVTPPQTFEWTGRGPYLTPGVFTMAAAAGGGRAIAQNNAGEPVWSTDGGVTFTASTTVIGPNLSNVGAYEAGTFVFSGNTDGNINTVGTYTSTNGGVSFVKGATLQTNSNSPTLMLTNGVGLLFMGLKNAEAGGNFFTSIDHGATWQRRNTFTNAGWGNSNSNAGGVWDGNQFVALCTDSATGHTLLVTCADGFSWTVENDLGAAFPTATLAHAVTDVGPVYLLSFGDTTISAAADIADLSQATATTPFWVTNNITCMFGDLDGPGGTALLFAFDADGNCAFTDDGFSWGPQVLGFATGDIPQFFCYDAVHDTPMVFAGIQSVQPGGSSYATRDGGA